MILIRLGPGDLARTRFAYSPLADIGESLYLLSSQSVPPPHDAWLAEVRPRLRGLDMTLLGAVAPARPFIASFFMRGAADRAVTPEQQLRAVAATPVDVLRADLAEVWFQCGLPPVLTELFDDPGGARRLAEALWDYWCAVLEPDWPAIRGVLDDDIAHRAAELTRHGVAGLLGGMHPELSVQDDLLRIDKRRHPGYHQEHDLAGAGLLLVPSVFIWPHLVFETGGGGPPSLNYPARGIGRLWGADSAGPAEDDTLGALVGRSRAAVLRALAVPRSTTELAVSLGQSAPAVSQHLAVLRRSALVVSWRSGRAVLYQRTALGSSIVDAATGTRDAPRPAAN